MNSAVPFWFQSADEGGEPPVPPIPTPDIGRSLRFRGGNNNSANTPGQFLEGPDQRPAGNFTYSAWWKRGDMVAGSPGSVPMTFLSFADNQCYQLREDELVIRRGGNAPQISNGVVRDPTAWYHCVWVNDGGTTTLYVNGVEQDITNEATPNGTEDMIIGCNTDAGDNKFIGYMADIYFLDGQVLDANSFGRFNNNGVWIPRVTSFIPGTLSDYVTASAGGFSAATTLIFDGNANTGAVSNTNDAVITFAPPAPITVNGDITMILGTNNVNATIQWNGQSYNWTAGGGTSQTVFANAVGVISEARPITLTPAAGTAIAWNEITVNGDTLLEFGDYGQTGFRLEFADPNDIGRDSSGNQNNFTPSATPAFDTDPVGIFSNNLFTSANAANPDLNSTLTNFETPGGVAANAFDGQAANTAASANNQEWIIWRPATAIRLTQSLQLQLMNPTSNVVINGTDTGISTSAGNSQIFTNISAALTFPFNLETIAVRGAASFQATLARVQLDGITYVDNTGVEYDSMEDSPTENYGLGNPLAFTIGADPTVITWSKANLAYTSTSNGLFQGLTSIVIRGDDTNTYYVEFSSTAAQGGTPGVIVAAIGSNPWTDNSFAWSTQNNTVFYNATQQANWNGATYAANEVAGLSYNGSTGVVVGFVDGVQAGTFTMDAGIDRVIGFQAPPQDIPILDFNLGQRPFLFQPANTLALQTDNLPVLPATSQDGRDHFRTVQAGGAFIQACAQGEINDQHGSTGFASGLWWFKDIANDMQHMLGNNLTGRDEIIWCPANPNAMDLSPYEAPAGNSVAWCWSATGLFTPGVTNMTTPSGLRNVEAGFSIVSATSAGSATCSFEHGLDAQPDFIIGKCENNAFNFAIYHTGLMTTPAELSAAATDEFLILNSDGNVSDNGSVMWDLSTAGEVGLGSNPAINRAGNTDRYTYYSWIAISGYSDFGSYTGNGNDNGPFIYTGFTPAFLLIKRTDNSFGGDWSIKDSTRNNANPVNELLVANTDDPQTQSDNIDFLANGFKIRTVSLANQTNGNYVYAAFSSSPFGASGILPTPAALQSPQPTPADGNAGVVSNSLRFRDNNAFLENTTIQCPAVFTYSIWFKKADTTTNNWITLLNQNNNANAGTGPSLGIDDNNVISYYRQAAAGNRGLSTAEFRDPSAWYHLVLQQNATGYIIWINGQIIPTTNVGAFLGRSGNFQIHRNFNGTFAVETGAYYADAYLVQDQTLEATAFGEYNAQGVWVPRTEADITTTITDGGGYGDNGFKLIMNQSNITFSDPPVLQDQSGQNNDFVMTGFELIDEDSVDFDLMVDGPSTNFSTVNALANANGENYNYFNANLGIASNTNLPVFANSVAIPSGDQSTYYFEMQNQDSTAGIGICSITGTLQDTFDVAGPNTLISDNGTVMLDGTQIANGWNNGNFGNGLNQVYGCRYDSANRRVQFSLSGQQPTYAGAAATAVVGTNEFAIPAEWGDVYLFATVGGTATATNVTVNYGQQPFRFQPANTESVQCRNLPAATITDGRTQFRAITGPGSGIATWSEPNDITISGPVDIDDATSGPFYALPVTPNGQRNWIHDFGYPAPVVRHTHNTTQGGLTYGLSEDGVIWTEVSTNFTVTANVEISSTAAENGGNNVRYVRLQHPTTTWGIGLTAVSGQTPILEAAQNTFASGVWWIQPTGGGNGQIVDSVRNNNQAYIPTTTSNGTTAAPAAYVAPAGNAVAWCWNLNASGVDVVDYTGDGDTVGGQTIAHNLGAVPTFMFTFTSGAGNNAPVYHQSLPATDIVTLNTNFDATTNSAYNSVRPTATDYQVANVLNANGQFTTYLFSEISGYSSMGSYVGNGDNDGPFIYTGFSPAVICVKRTDIQGSWIVDDNARTPNNPQNNSLEWENQGAATTTVRWDALSNGFKLRNSGAGSNATGGEYIYMAWAQSPFGGNNVQPANAR